MMTGKLDTRKFTEFIDEQNGLISDYEKLQKRYNEIVDTLTEKWKGLGADAFAKDAKIVKTNIIGLGDILSTMCSILSDARDIFDECDVSLGSANKNALKS